MDFSLSVHTDCQELPDLPPQTTHISSTGGNLLRLPEAFPKGLRILDLRNNRRLTSLPPLPDSLLHLDLDNSGIVQLDMLPPNLITLRCAHTPLTSLPSLPKTLATLSCANTELSVLPDLPPSLKTLLCHHTPLCVLPRLPASLDFLDCSWTSLACLPDISHVKLLSCVGCRLETLPRLPHGIELDCAGNPWSEAFATVLYGDSEEDWLSESDEGYSMLSRWRIDAINDYYDRMDEKARKRDRIHSQHLLHKNVIPDILVCVGTFLVGYA